MRNYDEPVEVLTGHAVVEAGLPPTAFVWRGRHYEVRAVLDRWVTRRPWWRAALDPELGGIAALAPAALEEEVWRVVAGGRSAPDGVYDLARGSRWRLVRLAD